MKFAACVLLIDCGKASKKTKGFVGGFAEASGAPFYQRG
jgi:hypothetical protein